MEWSFDYLPSPSAVKAKQCFPPEFTATFLMNTCCKDSTKIGVETESVPPIPNLPPAPYPIKYDVKI